MKLHRKLAFAAGILISLGATNVASAADMAVKARPVAAPVYNWTGCYIGGNVGGGWSRMDTTRVQTDLVSPSFANYGRENDSGFIGGGQASTQARHNPGLFIARSGFSSAAPFGSYAGNWVMTE
jgi:outer membrane immunogenic protein